MAIRFRQVRLFAILGETAVNARNPSQQDLAEFELRVEDVGDARWCDSNDAFAKGSIVPCRADQLQGRNCYAVSGRD